MIRGDFSVHLNPHELPTPICACLFGFTKVLARLGLSITHSLFVPLFFAFLFEVCDRAAADPSSACFSLCFALVSCLLRAFATYSRRPGGHRLLRPEIRRRTQPMSSGFFRCHKPRVLARRHYLIAAQDGPDLKQGPRPGELNMSEEKGIESQKKPKHSKKSDKVPRRQTRAGRRRAVSNDGPWRVPPTHQGGDTTRTGRR